EELPGGIRPDAVEQEEADGREGAGARQTPARDQEDGARGDGEERRGEPARRLDRRPGEREGRRGEIEHAWEGRIDGVPIRAQAAVDVLGDLQDHALVEQAHPDATDGELEEKDA